jgi:hypothetical protein
MYNPFKLSLCMTSKSQKMVENNPFGHLGIKYIVHDGEAFVHGALDFGRGTPGPCLVYLENHSPSPLHCIDNKSITQKLMHIKAS